MSDPAKCFQCGTTVSYETGFSMTGSLGDSSEDHIWCPEHTSKTGKGYTLSDLQRIRKDGQIERAKHQMAQIEQLGADVYFHATGRHEDPTREDDT